MVRLGIWEDPTNLKHVHFGMICILDPAAMVLEIANEYNQLLKHKL